MSAARTLKSVKTPDRASGKSPSAELGNLFREHRRINRLSLETVSRYMGDVAPSTLDQYEKGQKTIPLSDIYALANCLNIAPTIILNLIEKNNPAKKR